MPEINTVYYFDELSHQSEEGRVEQPVERLPLFRISIKAAEKNTERQT